MTTTYSPEEDSPEEQFPGLTFRIYETQFELDEDPSCPGTVYRGDNSEYGDKWTQWISAFATTEEEIRSHRISFRGRMSDGGTDLAPCLPASEDIRPDGENEFMVKFAITYMGEGSTPYVDRLQLIVDGEVAAEADIRDSVVEEQEDAS